MLGRLVAPAPPTSFGWEAPGVTPVLGPCARSHEARPVASPRMTVYGGEGPTATSDALAGTQWELRAIDGRPVIAGQAPLLITFGHDGRVSGTTGVNQLTASYSLTADYLTFGPLATTRRAGPPELMEQEHRLVASLAGMCSYRLDPHTLTIEGPMGLVELASTSPPPEPIDPVVSPPTAPGAPDAPAGP